MSKLLGIFHVAVEAVIINNGKILITQRSFKRSHAPGEWEMLTGRVNQGENFEEALKREVMEEAGLKIEVLQPFDTFHFFRGQDKIEHLGVSFICKYKGGRVKLDKKEQINFKWVTPKKALCFIKNRSIRSLIVKINKLLKNWHAASINLEKGVDYIGVGIGAVIINKERKIFLSQRGKNARNEKHRSHYRIKT